MIRILTGRARHRSPEIDFMHSWRHLRSDNSSVYNMKVRISQIAGSLFIWPENIATITSWNSVPKNSFFSALSFWLERSSRPTFCVLGFCCHQIQAGLAGIQQQHWISCSWGNIRPTYCFRQNIVRSPISPVENERQIFIFPTEKDQILETSNEIWIKVKLISSRMTLSHGVMKSDASSTQIDYLPFRELPKVMEKVMAQNSKQEVAKRKKKK